MIEYSEFKQILNLLRSPDIEVCELGRQLLSELPNVKIYGTKNHTEIDITGIYNTYYSWIPETEWLMKQMYREIFLC